MAEIRAHYRDVLLKDLDPSAGQTLEPFPGARVSVYKPDNTGLLDAVLYDDPLNGTGMPNPFLSGAGGEMEFWLDAAQSVNLLIEADGYVERTIQVLVDFDAPPETDLPNINVIEGDLTFTQVGGSQRIRGDFTSIPRISRVLVETIIPDRETIFGVIPNGTSTTTGLRLYGASDPDNASAFGFDLLAGGLARLNSTAAGTGTAAPIAIAILGETYQQINASGGISLLNGTDPGPGVVRVAGNLVVTGTITAPNLFVNPMTLAGDIIVGGIGGLPTRLGIGSNTQVLTMVAGVPAWATPVPGVHHTTHEPGGTDPMTVDAIAATGSLRSLGIGATQAAAGDHLHAAYVPLATIDAKGDLLAGTSNDAVARVGLGGAADGWVLTASAAQATGMGWAAPSGGLSQATADTLYVNVTGDAMTGSLQFTANATGLAGALFKTAGAGLNVQGVAGSSNDFALLTPAGVTILRNPTGTSEIAIPSQLRTANLIVTADASLNNLLAFVANAVSSGAGSLYKTAVNGLINQGATGSTNDFSLMTPTGTVILRNPTGTSNLVMAGNLTVTGTITGTASGNMVNPMTTAQDLIVGGASGLPARLGVGGNTQVLTVTAGVVGWATPASGFANPMTTAGDLIIGGASGLPTRLGIGSNTQVLTLVGGVPAWQAPVSGGMTNPMTTAGDIIIGGASGAPARMAKGTDGTVLTMVAGALAWTATTTATTLTASASASIATRLGINVPIATTGTINAQAFGDAVPLHVKRSGGGSTYIAIDGSGATGIWLNDASQAANARLCGFELNTQIMTYMTYTDAGASATRWGIDRLGNQSIYGYMQWPNNTTAPLAGGIGKTAADGLVIRGVTGSTNDFALSGNTGTILMRNPTATNNLIIPGNLTVSGTLTATVTGAMTNPMTTVGDIVVGSTAGAPARLGIGATNTLLSVVGGTPAWATNVTIPGTLGVTGKTIATGHLGVGAASNSLWASTFSVLDLGAGRGAFTSDPSGYIQLTQNLYHDGTNWRFATNAAVSMHSLLLNGTIGWYCAGAGAANAIYTPVQKMLLDSTNLTLNVAIQSNGGATFANLVTANGGLAVSGGTTTIGTDNLLVNPGFEIWQRGTGAFTTDSAYTADRWLISLGAGTVSVTRDSATTDTGSGYCAAVVLTGTPNTWLLQRVEDHLGLRGRTITVTARVRPSAANQMRIAIFDSVNSWRYGSYNTGTGAYETVIFTALIAAAATNVTVAVHMAAAGTVYIDSATLCIGSSALAYAPMHPAADLERCQRYYVEYGGTLTTEFIAALQATAATTALGVLQFPVEMCVAPTMSLSAAGDWRVFTAAGATQAATAVTMTNATRKAARLDITVASGLVAGSATILSANSTANARLRFEANPP